MKLLILTILLINSAFAQNAVKLEKGEKAEFSGFLVKTERLDQLLKAERKTPLLEAKFDLQEDLIKYHKGTAREARSKLLGEQMKGNLKGVAGFALGVLAVSIAFRVHQEVNR